MASRHLLRVLSKALAIGSIALAGLSAAADQPWRVVILNASDPHLPAFVAMDRATRDVFNAPDAHAVEIYAETLDIFRFTGAQLEEKHLALLKEKYAERPVDAVIAIATAALDFAERHRDTLWPNATIVFHSVWEDALQGRALSPQTTGIVLGLDIAGTAELALRLRPATKQLVVIAGTGSFDKRLVAMARSQLEPVARRIAIDYWVANDIDDLVARVRHLPPTTSVLYLSLFRDAKERVFVPRDALARLAAASSVPIFGVFDTYLGKGMIAGRSDDTEARGRLSAQVVQSALAESRTGKLPPPATPAATCVADARELKRWGIAESLLPRDCAVHFIEPTAWERYRWQIVIGIAIILSQSLLITALVLQHRRRQRAEVAMQAARSELVHAARLASMGELTASIAHEIKQPLSAILAHAETAELLLESDQPPVAQMREIIADIRSDDLRANAVITRLRGLLAKQAMERKAVDVNAVIAETLNVLDAEAQRRGVVVTANFDGALPRVTGDPVHLQQVVLNLVLNALDAVVATSGRTPRVDVRTRALADAVEITVADNGHGIDSKVASRVFDSFVTTKPRGLGLGLSITRSIVEAHGGTIEAADGNPGAVFRVQLPIARAEVHAAEPQEVRPSLAPSS